MKSISAADFLSELAKERQKVLVLDVRTPQEFFVGHHSDALNVPLAELGSSDVAFDDYDVIYSVCRSGGRSAAACSLLSEMGHDHAVNVDGGMLAIGPLL